MIPVVLALLMVAALCACMTVVVRWLARRWSSPQPEPVKVSFDETAVPSAMDMARFERELAALHVHVKSPE